jgi:hypothetical protein
LPDQFENSGARRSLCPQELGENSDEDQNPRNEPKITADPVRYTRQTALDLASQQN